MPIHFFCSDVVTTNIIKTALKKHVIFYFKPPTIDFVSLFEPLIYSPTSQYLEDICDILRRKRKCAHKLHLMHQVMKIVNFVQLPISTTISVNSLSTKMTKPIIWISSHKRRSGHIYFLVIRNLIKRVLFPVHFFVCRLTNGDNALTWKEYRQIVDA